MAAHGVGAERGVQRRHIRVFRGEAIARNRREATVLARSGGVERLTLPMKTLAAQANGNVSHDAGTAGRHRRGRGRSGQVVGDVRQGREHLQDPVEPRDREHLEDPVGRTDDPHPATLGAHHLQPPDQDAQTRGIQKSDSAEVNDQVFAPGVDRLIESPSQLRCRIDVDLPTDVHNRALPLRRGRQRQIHDHNLPLTAFL